MIQSPWRHLRAAFVFQAPFVFRNEPLLVGRGETRTVSELVLGLGDSDNPEDVVLMVLEPPRHGRLLGPSGDPATLSLGDLAGGRLRYAHDGSDSRQDTALLQASDGYHFQNILLHVSIAPKVCATHQPGSRRRACKCPSVPRVSLIPSNQPEKGEDWLGFGGRPNSWFTTAQTMQL